MSKFGSYAEVDQTSCNFQLDEKGHIVLDESGTPLLKVDPNVAALDAGVVLLPAHKKPAAQRVKSVTVHNDGLETTRGQHLSRYLQSQMEVQALAPRRLFVLKSANGCFVSSLTSGHLEDHQSSRTLMFSDKSDCKRVRDYLKQHFDIASHVSAGPDHRVNN